MIVRIMKIFKNLFGDGSKIHSDEIIIGNRNDNKILSEKLKEPSYPMDALEILSLLGNVRLSNHGCFEFTGHPNISIDDITETGFYYLTSMVDNKPTTSNMYFIILTAHNGHTFQLGTDTSTSHVVLYARKGVMSNGIMGWGEWRRIVFDNI